MKAAEHIPNKGDATIKSSVLSERFSSINIPWRRVALYVSLCLGFFLLGFVPMWFKANNAIEQRDAAQREVRLGQLQSTLGAAMVDVQRGEYEPARQLTSDFYTNLRSQIDAANDPSSRPHSVKLKAIAYERDEVITLLARSDRRRRSSLCYLLVLQQNHHQWRVSLWMTTLLMGLWRLQKLNQSICKPLSRSR